MEWLQSHISESLIPIISQCSLPGEEIVLVLIIGILYWGINKKMGRYIGLNLLFVSHIRQLSVILKYRKLLLRQQHSVCLQLSDREHRRRAHRALIGPDCLDAY